MGFNKKVRNISLTQQIYEKNRHRAAVRYNRFKKYGSTDPNYDRSKNLGKYLGAKGKYHGRWKGGKRVSGGYIQVHCPNHPHVTKDGYVNEHRLIMEKHIDRYLHPHEIVHHIDFDKSNNNIENLHLFFSYTEHSKYHYYLITLVREMLNSNERRYGKL